MTEFPSNIFFKKKESNWHSHLTSCLFFSYQFAATKMSIQTITGRCKYYRLGNFTKTRWRVHEEGNCIDWANSNIDKCQTYYISTLFAWHILGSRLQWWGRQSCYASRWLYSRIFHPSKLVRTIHIYVDRTSIMSTIFFGFHRIVGTKGGGHAGAKTVTWKFNEIVICAAYQIMLHMQLCECFTLWHWHDKSVSMKTTKWNKKHHTTCSAASLPCFDIDSTARAHFGFFGRSLPSHSSLSHIKKINTSM